MSNVVCPVCGTEYAGWSVRCPNCGTALQVAAEDIDLAQVADEEKVTYELGEWPLEVQTEAAAAMAESGIPHVWDGTDLVVHEDWEEQADAVLEAVERDAIAAGQLEPSAETGEGGGEVVYDLAEWGEADRARLDQRLDAGDVPHVWEGTSLVVAAADEVLVEEILDAVEHPDALDVEPDDTEEAAEDEVRHELLSDLFDAADRLKHDPGDDRGLEELTGVLAEADPARPPYGFPPLVWRTAVDLADELGDLLVVAAGGTPEVGEDAVPGGGEDLSPVDGDEDPAVEDAGAAGEGADETPLDAVEAEVAATTPHGHFATDEADEVDAERVAALEAVQEADDDLVEEVVAGEVDVDDAIVVKATALRDLLRPYV